MHARELTELAAVASIRGATLIRSGCRIPEAFVERYWDASRRRLDRWTAVLQRIRATVDGAAMQAQPSGSWLDSNQLAVLQEILLSEPLTRVWAAVLDLIDQTRQNALVAPVGRCVMLGHFEARHRVLSLLSTDAAVSDAGLRDIDRLRRHIERWNDLLIGVLATQYHVFPYAVDSQRARLFAAEFENAMRDLELASLETPLRRSLRDSLVGVDAESCAPNARLNRAFASAVLCCLESGRPSPTRKPSAAWLSRLAALTDDTQSLVREFLEPAPRPRR